MVLLNGADGMADVFAKALTMGGTGLGLARQLLTTMSPAAQERLGTGVPPAPRAQAESIEITVGEGE